MSTLLTTRLTYPIYELLTRRKIISKWRELERTQWLPRDELLALQWDRLSRLIDHAYESVPFYRRRFDAAGTTPAEILEPADLARIPPLTKHDLRRHSAEMKATNIGNNKLYRNATGGSTGEPTSFYNDRRDLDYQSAVVLRDYRWAGLEPGEKQVMLWGSAFDLALFSTLKGRLADRLLRRHVLPAFDMSSRSLATFVAEINRLQPRLITGYSSALEVLAGYLLQSGDRIEVSDLRGIVSTAETLRSDQRLLLEQAFGCAVFDRYGSREVGCIAHECEEHRLHINAENLFVEVVRGGDPVPAGASGEIAITTLNNYGFPFVRYLIGDFASLSDELCPCGRGLPVMQELLGRVHDILITPDGRFLPGEFFPHLMKEVPGVDRFQVVQRDLKLLEIRIVAGEDFQPPGTEFIREQTRRVVGDDMTIDIEFVEELPSLPSGKLRFTVSELDIDFSQVN